jgi:hypothetical protein
MDRVVKSRMAVAFNVMCWVAALWMGYSAGAFDWIVK